MKVFVETARCLCRGSISSLARQQVYFTNLACADSGRYSPAMSLPHTIELEVLKPDLHHGPSSEATVKISPATLTNASNAQPSTRFAYFNQPEKHIGLNYSSNVVVTSKYTLLNFFPKTLFMQFQRLANIFFIIVSGLQVFTDLSPTGRRVSPHIPAPLASSFLLDQVHDCRSTRCCHCF